MNAKFKETIDSASRGMLLLSHKDLRLNIARFKGKMEANSVTICEGACLNADLRIGCPSEEKVLRRGLQ